MDISVPLIDIVLPCFNPPANWERTVITNFNAISGMLENKATLHLMLVNDGSKRNIGEESVLKIRSSIKSFEYISYPLNKGKGYALRKGVIESKGEYCIYTDIDFPYTTESFLKIANELLSSNADIAVGVRDEKYYSNMPAERIRISKFVKSLIAATLRLKITDTQCGLKGFNKAGKEIFLKTTINRYLFDMEFIFLASAINTIVLKPVNVVLRDNIAFSKMNTKVLLTEGINFVKIYFRSFFHGA